jgi:hypothetical protein
VGTTRVGQTLTVKDNKNVVTNSALITVSIHVQDLILALLLLALSTKSVLQGMEKLSAFLLQSQKQVENA